MNTNVKASCSNCGEVNIFASDILLTECSNISWSYYTFTCPSCSCEVKKPADANVIGLLHSAHVKKERWEVPHEALEVHEGLPLRYDDLLDFVLLLGVETNISDLAKKETCK